MAALILLLASGCTSTAAGGGFSAESRVNTGWEYDDNVFESSSGKTAGGAVTAALFSRLKFSSPAALTLLDYNLGYQAHHRLDSDDGLVAGDVLVNRLNAHSRRRLGGLWTAGAGGDLKVRNVYRKNRLNLLSEEGYTRGSALLTATRRLGGNAALRLDYRLTFCNFETFTTFDYVSHSPGGKLIRRLNRNTALSFGYTYIRRGYERTVNVRAGDGSLVRGNGRQRDNLHLLEAGVSYSKGMLFNFTWALLRNDSNNYGFSYWNNRFTLLFADRLPGGLFLNAYLFFELKRYSDETGGPLLVDILTEENDNNGAVVKLSRELAGTLEASLTVALYRNESSIRELNFRKNVITSALTVRF
ncbi:MAG: hypothetical protein FVQ81_15870 [Candidatus Glassbacteria bacterium]|nr:hypothetical protein [Candidatus Glassbacteria bacterium]